jgi:hypothetical protein
VTSPLAADRLRNAEPLMTLVSQQGEGRPPASGIGDAYWN